MLVGIGFSIWLSLLMGIRTLLMDLKVEAKGYILGKALLLPVGFFSKHKRKLNHQHTHTYYSNSHTPYHNTH